MRMYTINAKQLLFGFCAVVLALTLAVCGFKVAKAEQETVSQTRRIPIYNVEKEEKVIALSFDAAWGNEDTQTLIDILGKYDIKATFFVVGEWVDKYPGSVKALADAGHEVMNHSNSHPDMVKLTVDEIKEEIELCNNKIATVTGVRPTLFRAPYGSYNNQLIDTLDGLDMYCIQWNIDSLDWKNPAVDQLVNNVVSKAAPGSICLFHNAAVNTPEALPQIIDALIAEGYSFVPVSKLIMTDNYYIDHAGCQREKSNTPHLETDLNTVDDVIAPYNTQPYYGDYYMECMDAYKKDIEDLNSQLIQ